MIKDRLPMQETQVRSLGREDALEEGMATHSSVPAWRIPMDGGAWQAAVHGVTESQTRLSDRGAISHQGSNSYAEWDQFVRPGVRERKG